MRGDVPQQPLQEEDIMKKWQVIFLNAPGAQPPKPLIIEADGIAHTPTGAVLFMREKSSLTTPRQAEGPKHDVVAIVQSFESIVMQPI